MMQREALMERIENERRKLNTMLEEGKAQEAYAQSLLVDSLIEEYLAL